MKILLALTTAVLLAGCNESKISTEPPAADVPQPLPNAYAYEKNGPRTVILFSTSAEGTARGETAGMAQMVPALRAEGFSILFIDLPCHGADKEDMQPLACWRRRVEAGNTELFTRFCDRLAEVLSIEGIQTASIVGESRGGYVASICAGRDYRITTIALLKPVTDLQKLSEFNGYTVDQTVYGLSLYAGPLIGRPILLRIGPNDTRVDTQSALIWGGMIGAEIMVIESEGHKLPEDGYTTAWLVRTQSS